MLDTVLLTNVLKEFYNCDVKVIYSDNIYQLTTTKKGYTVLGILHTPIRKRKGRCFRIILSTELENLPIKCTYITFIHELGHFLSRMHGYCNRLTNDEEEYVVDSIALQIYYGNNALYSDAYEYYKWRQKTLKKIVKQIQANHIDLFNRLISVMK